MLPVLTLQTTDAEAGGVGFNGTSDFSFDGSDASIIPDAGLDNNGDVVLGSPHSQTYTFAQLVAAGINNSSELGIIYNTNETGSNINTFLNDVRLGVWTAGGTFFTSTGPCTPVADPPGAPRPCPGDYPVTNQGQGGDGYLFLVSGTLIDFTDPSRQNWRVGLWASISGTDDGPEDFYFQEVECSIDCDTPHPIPEPTSLLLLGSGLFGGASAMYRRRKAAKAAKALAI